MMVPPAWRWEPGGKGDPLGEMDTQYGLQAGVFTESIRSALRCANEIEAGSVLINKESTFRTDAMPFGGFKSSGIGKEGIKYAVEDMCKTKLIAFNCR